MNIPDILKDGVTTPDLLVIGTLYAGDWPLIEIKGGTRYDLFNSMDDYESTVQFIADAINEKVERSKNND